MTLPILVLKPGKEKPVRNKHHWIFSGAVKKMPDAPDGALVSVFSSEGENLGSAYINRRSSILARMVAFSSDDPMEAIQKRLDEAFALRNALLPQSTTAYRLINAEGDGLPGLIVDKYADYLVLQISTLGMEKLKQHVVDHLIKRLHPKGILEKSTLPSRQEEGLPQVTALLYGEVPETIPVLEHGVAFKVDPYKGQKTGFFLDQREMRQKVRELSHGRRVLNCFSYTGGFSVYAALGGAKEVVSVDCSKEAILMAEENMQLNEIKECELGFIVEDVFAFLRKPLPYDLVILDPPAFAKRAKDVVSGCRGYKEINRLAFQGMPANSLLLTCSCSYHVDEALFQKVVFQAASEARRDVRIIGRHHQAFDHPVNLFHPEGDYLKSLLLAIV